MTTWLPGNLDQEHSNSSAEPTKAALFCAPGRKANANTLQNHNHPHMNYLPFLGHKKWEAVHRRLCWLWDTLLKQLLRKSFAGLGLALFVGVAWRIVIELQEEILA